MTVLAAWILAAGASTMVLAVGATPPEPIALRCVLGTDGLLCTRGNPSGSVYSGGSCRAKVGAGPLGVPEGDDVLGAVGFGFAASRPVPNAIAPFLHEACGPAGEAFGSVGLPFRAVAPTSACGPTLA